MTTHNQAIENNSPSGDGPYLFLAEAADYLRVDPATVSRYVNAGVHGIRLRTVRVGGRPRTTIALCDQFVRETTAAAEAADAKALEGIS